MLREREAGMVTSIHVQLIKQDQDEAVAVAYLNKIR
jgi:hypothetical protein